jgi:hypothetical protein
MLLRWVFCELDERTEAGSGVSDLPPSLIVVLDDACGACSPALGAFRLAFADDAPYPPLTARGAGN